MTLQEALVILLTLRKLLYVWGVVVALTVKAVFTLIFIALAKSGYQLRIFRAQIHFH